MRKTLAGPLIGVATHALLGGTGLPPEARRLAGILACTVWWWMTEAMPLPVAGLIASSFCVAFGVASAKKVMAPYGDPVIFLFIGSFWIAESMSVHGLDRRLAGHLLSWRWVNASPRRLLIGLGLLAALISMWMSNTATTAMLLPVVLGVLETLPGSARDPRLESRLLLMLSFAASVGGLGTPVGTPPNLIGIGIVFLLLAYIVIQGTRAAAAWRKAAAAGDVEVIRRILEDGISAWRSMRRPKDVTPDVWRGIQSLEVVDVGPDSLQVSCQAESEYRLLDGRWVETANPLQEGIAITARAADMLLYELPHFKPQRVQVDVYTTFRGPDGASHRQCILSTPAGREAARGVDWESWTAAQIVEALGGRYRLAGSGLPLPIDPEQPSPRGRRAQSGSKARVGR